MGGRSGASAIRDLPAVQIFVQIAEGRSNAKQESSDLCGETTIRGLDLHGHRQSLNVLPWIRILIGI